MESDHLSIMFRQLIIYSDYIHPREISSVLLQGHPFCYHWWSGTIVIQWNLRIKDTWGLEQVSFIRRCPSFGASFIGGSTVSVKIQLRIACTGMTYLCGKAQRTKGLLECRVLWRHVHKHESAKEGGRKWLSHNNNYYLTKMRDYE